MLSLKRFKELKKKRERRLIEFIELNAPEMIIEQERKLVRQSYLTFVLKNFFYRVKRVFMKKDIID